MLYRTFGGQPKTLIGLESLTIVVIIGFLDFLGGWSISLFAFYALPIGVAGWFVGRIPATICALACGMVWYWANVDVHPYGSHYAFVWTVFSRTVYFLFVAIGVAAIKRHREESRARMEIVIRTRELEQEIVRASESEQMRIGQDLHDGLCQNLLAIDCAAACLKADLEAKSLPETRAAERIQQLLRETVLEARNLAHDIFPVQIDAEGFSMALEDLAKRMNCSPDVSVAFEDGGDADVTDSQTSMHLYRIAQQAVSNAMAHAAAKSVVVRLAREESDGAMTIVDDGCGLGAKTNNRGMGMRTMAYRARLIGGNLTVESTPGMGTKVCCRFPLHYG